jgi:hypothetical protein
MALLSYRHMPIFSCFRPTRPILLGYSLLYLLHVAFEGGGIFHLLFAFICFLRGHWPNGPPNGEQSASLFWDID